MNEELLKAVGIDVEPAEKVINGKDVIETTVPFNFDEASDKTKVSATELITEAVKPKEAKKIDLNSLNIVDTIATEKEKDLRIALYGSKSAFQVVAAQSGYMAQIAPLVHKDIISLMTSNLSRYERQKAIYKVMYDKLVNISCGKLSFEEWLKCTSSGDIESLYYGLYCSTFPGLGTFTFECPDCEEQTTMKIDNANLVKTANNDKMKKLINKVSKNVLSKEEMRKYSLIGKYEGYKLTDSGIVMEVRTPSLWDVLDMLQKVPEKLIDRDATSAEYMLYINRFLIPIKDTNNYSEERDRQEILRIIDNLSLDDSQELQNAIQAKYEENRISYSIKNIKCPKCHAEFKDTEISIEDILFTLIYEKAQ